MHFGAIFSLNLSVRLKTVLNGIKALKRFSKATLNKFFIKILDDDKNKLSIG